MTPKPTNYDTDSYPIRIDNHSSYCVSNTRSDFVGPLQPIKASVKGIGGAVSVRSKGTVKWSWEDDMGVITHHLIPNTIFIPSSPDRILSPQHWSQERTKLGDATAHAFTDHTFTKLIWKGGSHTKSVPLDPLTNVATMLSKQGYQAIESFSNVVSDDEVDDKAEQRNPSTSPNSSDDEQDGPVANNNNGPHHTPLPMGPRPITFNVVPTDDSSIEPIEDDLMDSDKSPQQEFMMWHQRLNHLSYRRMQLMVQEGVLPSRLGNVRPPKCAACMIGRATRRPWRTKAPKQSIKVASITAPGDCVSIDQLQSTTPGLIAQMRGFLTKERYHYATVFVDHYSSLSFVYLQKTSNMEETLKAKETFERYAAIRGVMVKHYHADNGRFADRGFINHVRDKGQTISFCGTNAHHQNGVAEKRIRDLQEAARTALIHAKKRWPDAIESHLWPYALRAANHTHNHTISIKSKKMPINLFSQVEEANELRHFHTFGCPSYVLDPELQSGKRRTKHKWEDRARVSINLGPSPQHGKSVHLMLNTQTGHVTPQFHATFDDHFDTVKQDSGVHLPKCLWQLRTYFRAKVQERSPPPSQTKAHRTRTFARPPTIVNNNTAPEPTVEPAVPPITDDSGGDNHEVPVNDPPLDPVTTRSGHSIRSPERLLHVMTSIANYDGSHELLYQELHPFLLFKATTNPDILYLDEALEAPDRDEFIKAMLKEVRDHERRGHWKVVPSSKVPKGVKVLPAVWSMARKREMLTGHVYKWKSRLNLGGHKMEHGIDYDLTFAPVVAWPTIRLFLAFFAVNGWKTRQLDLVLAYPHAKITRPTFMKIPKGFRFRGATQHHVLQILYNLYGGKDSGRIYFLFMSKYLVSMGFIQSSIDPCIFFLGKVILLMYVDDFIIGGLSDEIIDAAVQIIGDNADVEDKGNINDYVGVHVEWTDNKTIELTQPHLIQAILDDLRLDDSAKSLSTPCVSSLILHADLEGEDFDQHFDYRSIIGKLNYLAKSTRADIEYAVHQCARFMSNPKRSHGQAIKRIGRYLLGTKELGLVLRPDPNRSFDCYVDASFAGEWIKSNADQAMYDPNTARSRSGFIIFYAGVPLVWSSKLQTEVTLSSTEAEMIALSASTREFIFLVRLIKETGEITKMTIHLGNSKIYCRVYEDNKGTLELAKEYRIRPRTKHINVKYWHFRQFMDRHKGILSFHWIQSEDQIADVLTKPLGSRLHVKFARIIQGWRNE